MTSTEKIIPDEESLKTAAALDDKVKDKFQRPLISLRISITNRCNVKCFYCHHGVRCSGGLSDVTGLFVLQCT